MKEKLLLKRNLWRDTKWTVTSTCQEFHALSNRITSRWTQFHPKSSSKAFQSEDANEKLVGFSIDYTEYLAMTKQENVHP